MMTNFGKITVNRLVLVLLTKNKQKNEKNDWR